jgi:hypothetical protein
VAEPRGASAVVSLIADAARNQYSTVQFGGTITPTELPCGVFGCGVVFKVGRDGQQTLLYTAACLIHRRLAFRDIVAPGAGLLL